MAASTAARRRDIGRYGEIYGRDRGEIGEIQLAASTAARRRSPIPPQYLPPISTPYLPRIPLYLPYISQALEALEAAEEMLDAWKREHA